MYSTVCLKDVMTQRQFDAATARALMRLAYPDDAGRPYIERDNGLYVDESFREVCPPGTIFDWTPADEMDWPGSPNPDTAPFLPIPFTANQLAACMLDGVGQSIQFVLDRRIGYPLDVETLNSFSTRHRWARDALKEAYSLAAAAQLEAGEFDYGEERRVHVLAQQFDEANGLANTREGVFDTGISQAEASTRRERAVASLAELKVQLRASQASVAGKWVAWRKAMVFQLLCKQNQLSELSLAGNASKLEVRHSMHKQAKQRRDLLDPLIEAAQIECGSAFDSPAVWALLLAMAKIPKCPFFGVTEDGLQWMDANDTPQIFTLKNLRDRLKRREKSALELGKTR